MVIRAITADIQLSLDDVRQAAERIDPFVHRTPFQRSRTFSRMVGAEVYLKLENLQRTGSYKLRGALNRVLTLSEQEKERGVIAASAGNHAQGVAVAAISSGVKATIVMPSSAALAKVAATREYGARVILHGQTFDDAQEHALRLATERGLTYIHPFDDWMVMAGQGTVALEMLQEVPDLDVIVVPVGGGGLIAGISVAAKSLRPRMRVIGVQAAAAPACWTAYHGTQSAHPTTLSTIADGIAVKRPGELTMAVIRRYVDDMVLVKDEAIYEAIVLLMERAKTVAEGAGAVALASLLSGQVEAIGQKVGVLVSGGNIDLNMVDRVIQHGLTSAGRYLMLRTYLQDKPGQLYALTKLLARRGVNIIEVVHHRAGVNLPTDMVELELTLETRDRAHGEAVVQALRHAGYRVELPYWSR